MSGPDYSNYQQTCSQINETTIHTFKQQREVIGIIENVNKTFGDLYLQNIHKYPEHTQIDWSRVKQLNDIGSPQMETFEINNQEIQLSPTTLRYVQYSLDILTYMTNKQMNNTDVVEVGGGYGFQAVLLYELARYFSININSYTIVDLPEANNMQNQYIKACQTNVPFKTIVCYNVNDDTFQPSNNSFFISNYALGEFTRELQDFYVETIVKKMAHGYICWNFSVGNPYVHNYFNDPTIIYEEENPQTNCPPVKSYIIKF
jgi:hypothetical protein